MATVAQQQEVESMRRIATVLVLAGVLIAGPAGAALAHECIVANRSAQGSEKASSSENWFHVTTDDLIVFITEDPSLVPLLSDTYRAAVAEAGLPTSFAIFEHHTIGFKGPDKDIATPGYGERSHGNDGQGIDHVFSGGYIDQYVTILLDLLQA